MAFSYFIGMDYLRIDIASHMGYDKEPFEYRIQWVHDHEDMLEVLEDEADDYFRYAAVVMAYREAQKGIPSGHLVGLDAPASGPQILSCMTGCKVGAANTGTIGNRRMDVYGVCTEAMSNMLEDMQEYSREIVKPAFMTYFYGSKKEPKKAFGEDTQELAAFYAATREVCPGACMFMDIVSTLWDEDAMSYHWDLPDGFNVLKKVKDTVEDRIEIDTLDGHPTFLYRHKVNQSIEKGRFLAADAVHSVDGYIVRELTARCDHDKGALRSVAILLRERLRRGIEAPRMSKYEKLWRKHECLSIEGAEYINEESIQHVSRAYVEALLRLVETTTERPSFKVVSIHDELKCHPNYMNWVRQTYIDLLAELAEGRVLDTILSAIAGHPIRIEKLSDDLVDDIRNGQYALA